MKCSTNLGMVCGLSGVYEGGRGCSMRGPHRWSGSMATAVYKLYNSLAASKHGCNCWVDAMQLVRTLQCMKAALRWALLAAALYTHASLNMSNCLPHPERCMHGALLGIDCPGMFACQLGIVCCPAEHSVFCSAWRGLLSPRATLQHVGAGADAVHSGISARHCYACTACCCTVHGWGTSLYIKKAALCCKPCRSCRHSRHHKILTFEPQQQRHWR